MTTNNTPEGSHSDVADQPEDTAGHGKGHPVTEPTVPELGGGRFEPAAVTDQTEDTEGHGTSGRF